MKIARRFPKETFLAEPAKRKGLPQGKGGGTYFK
jgi:hypothetical protein